MLLVEKYSGTELEIKEGVAERYGLSEVEMVIIDNNKFRKLAGEYYPSLVAISERKK